MATGTYAPDPDLRVVDANGVPVSGGLVWTYIAGTTTPTPTYTDVGLLVPNTNPIVAGSDGRFVAFLVGGLSYKFVYEMPAVPPAHGANIATRDNILAVTTIVPGTGGGVTQNTVLTGTVNDFPLLPGCSVLYCNNAAPLTITGFAGGVAGQRLTVFGTGAQASFAHMSSGSLAANRLQNFASSAPTSLAAPISTWGSITYIYRGDVWSIMSHDQGEWIKPAFNAADYTASPGGTWTLTLASVSSMKYRLSGKMLTILFQLNTATVGGAPTWLAIANGQFGGFQLISGSFVAIGFTTETGSVFTQVQTNVQVSFAKQTGAAFVAGGSYFYGTFTVEVV